jgi:hypothetical protein
MAAAVSWAFAYLLFSDQLKKPPNGSLPLIDNTGYAKKLT